MGTLSGEVTAILCLPLYSIRVSSWGTEFACKVFPLTLLHSERPKLHTILAFLSAIGLRQDPFWKDFVTKGKQTGSHKNCLPSKKMAENIAVYSDTHLFVFASDNIHLSVASWWTSCIWIGRDTVWDMPSRILRTSRKSLKKENIDTLCI